MKIGKKIKILREENKMSQEQLSIKLGKAGRTYVYRLENGVIQPSLIVLDEIAKIFNCEINIEFKKNKL